MSEGGESQAQQPSAENVHRDNVTSHVSDSDDFAAPNPTWSEWWAEARAKYLNKEGAEIAFYALMSLLIFLAVAGSLGTAVYVGALLIGPIAAGLAAALPLGIPAVALTIIGAGILIASVAALLRFVQIHWEMHQILKSQRLPVRLQEHETEPSQEVTFIPLKALSADTSLQAMAKTPLRYAFVLFTAAFVMGVSTQDAIKMYDENYTMAAKLKYLVWHNKYHAAAIVAALGLGIALAVPVVPYVMATVTASFGLPYGVAVLFGAVAAATIIAVTYQLLASLTTLKRLYDLVRGAYHRGVLRIDAFYYFYTAAAVVGVAVAVAAAYLFFVPLVNVLTPVLVSSSLATFLAIATSASLAVALMNFVPAVVVGGPAFIKTKFYKDSTLQEWWNAPERVWANWGKKGEVELGHGEKPASSWVFCSRKADEEDDDEEEVASWNWRTCSRTPATRISFSKERG